MTRIPSILPFVDRNPIRFRPVDSGFPVQFYRRLGSSLRRNLNKFLLLIFISLSSQNCLPYLAHLGKEQLSILWNKEPIPQVLSNPDTDRQLKESLLTVQKVQHFAIHELALSEEGGFRQYVKISRDAIGWNVSASYPLEIKSYTWWFPIAGRVPYKGFFDKELAETEEKKLKSLGLDTRIRTIGGYSTLGWFDDPIFSVQLEADPIELVRLIIHEMAHSTVYIPGDSTFNESYASFVEEKGSIAYFSHFEGKKSKKIQEILDSKERSKEVYSLMESTRKKLEAMYSSPLQKNDKLKRKAELLDAFKKNLLALVRNRISKKQYKKLSERQFNNEDFQGVSLYHSGEDFFESEWKRAKMNFSDFHLRMKRLMDLSEEERESMLQGK